MTRSEFDAGLLRLAQFFPNFEPGEKNISAWYHALSDMPVQTFYAALGLVCKNEPRWWPDTNLAGLVGKYHAEARDIVGRRIEAEKERRPERLLDEPRMSPEEAKKLFDKLHAELGLDDGEEVFKRMPAA